MTSWQRRARLVVAVFGVVFAVFVARELKRRDPPTTVAPVARTDAKAIVETHIGSSIRLDKGREVGTIAFKAEYLYADGTVRFEGVTIDTKERNGESSSTTRPAISVRPAA